jgi:hypothetical protein
MAMAVCQWSGVPIRTASKSFVSEQVAVVAETLRARGHPLRLVDPFGEDIANRGDIDLSGLDEGVHHAPSPAPGADQPQTDPVVGAENPAVRGRQSSRGRHGEAGFGE